MANKREGLKPEIQSPSKLLARLFLDCKELYSSSLVSSLQDSGDKVSKDTPPDFWDIIDEREYRQWLFETVFDEIYFDYDEEGRMLFCNKTHFHDWWDGQGYNEYKDDKEYQDRYKSYLLKYTT